MQTEEKRKLHELEIARIILTYASSQLATIHISSENGFSIREPSNHIDEISASLINSMLLNPNTQKLRLIPMEKMNAEQLNALCKVACPEMYGDYRFSKWQTEYDIDTKTCRLWGAWLQNKKEKDYKFYINFLTGEVELDNLTDEAITPTIKHYYWQWYFENAIAIPLYHGASHWANGKTAIELEIAEDFTL